MASDQIGASAHDSGHGGLQLLISAGPARFVADEPADLGGLDLGPTPHDLICAGLAACTAQTLRLYARHKGWALGQVRIDVSHQRDPAQSPPDHFVRVLSLGGPLNTEQRERLLEIAERCPVHRLLTGGASVQTSVTSPED
jgi:putative redox protein